ncbi:MAG: hypothetical protein EOP62_07405 [Sphingomonadales bacterium]|nr:MAG: hypothetical protein EOP62_07405 [Sphingomonadales bacterium]
MLTVLLFAMLAQDRPVLPAPDDDAMHIVPREKCEPRDGEITVCGINDTARFRLQPTNDARWKEAPLRPDFKLPGGATGTIRAEQRGLPGASAPAAFVTIKIPFGGKKKPDDK